MSDLVQEMTKDYVPFHQDNKMKKIIGKWSKTGLLKNLDEGREMVVARLLENQAVDLRRQIDEASNVGNIAGFNKIAFPLVRRVFGQLLANEIVAVQPMSLPSGLLFYLDFTFDRNKNGQTAGGSLYGDLSSVDNGGSGVDGLGAQTTGGGFYNLNTGYSKRMFELSTAAPTYSGVTETSTLLGNVTVSGLNFTLSNSAATDLKSVHEMRFVRRGELEFDGGTFNGLAGVQSLTGSTWGAAQDWTMTQLTGGVVQVFTSEIIPVNDYDATSTTATVLVGPAETSVSTDNGTNNLGDFESVSGIPEVNISVSSVAVTAQTRKLKAKWTPELAQDLNAYHALDPEVELTTILSEVVTTEIDRDILGQLLSGAAVQAAWSRAIGNYVTAGPNGLANPLNLAATNSFGTGDQAFFGTQQDWYQTLGETITTVSNEIHKRNLRSGANWLVTSPDVASIIESINSFRPTASYDPTEITYSMGIEKVGTLTNRFTVYKDPYFPADKILVGYKGTGFLDAGFVYAPYVPLVVTPTIFETEDFTPRKGVMHRSATQMVRSEYYGRIHVANLNVVGG